jgi:hypothetical protein
LENLYRRRITDSWKEAFKSKSFKIKAAIIACFHLIIVFIFPYFFNAIQNRKGTVLNDPVLNWITPVNLSVLVFGVIWFMAIYMFVRFANHPRLLLLFFCCYALMFIIRFFTISLMPLEPPVGIIALADPLTDFFYGGRFISKDLFFSGHTATMMIMFLCFRKRIDKIIGLTATIVVGIAVIVQHVHYTFDVFSAPFFAYVIYLMGRKLILEMD